jgi:hypothetical protein
MNSLQQTQLVSQDATHAIFIVAQLVAQVMGIDNLSQLRCHARHATHLKFYLSHFWFWMLFSPLIMTCHATWDFFKPRLTFSRQVCFKYILWIKYDPTGYKRKWNWRDLNHYSHLNNPFDSTCYIYSLSSTASLTKPVASLPENYTYSKLYLE